jgi:hypothetical protein
MPVPQNAKFCQECGAQQFFPDYQPPQPVQSPPLAPFQKVSRSSNNLVIALVILLVGGIATALALFLTLGSPTHIFTSGEPKTQTADPFAPMTNFNTNSANVNSPSEASPTPVFTVSRHYKTDERNMNNANMNVNVPNTSDNSEPQTIANAAFTVGAGHMKYYTFTVSGTQTVSGRFDVQGGNNDIYCYIVDDDGFVNAQNHHRANLYYNSGQVTVGNIYVTLNAGRYYLVFDNTASMITPKAVSVSATLQ